MQEKLICLNIRRRLIGQPVVINEVVTNQSLVYSAAKSMLSLTF